MATTLTTEHSYTGNGSTTNYSVTFTYLKEADVKVTLDHVATTAYTFANASTISFTTAPANGVGIRIFRDTDVDAARFVFSSGSALKAGELNENLDQLLYADQEKARTDNIADEAVTTAKLRDDAVTTAKLANLSVATAQLVDSSVTTAKIADDAVTPAKLSDTAVTAGIYTAVDITVDAQGRVTAASSGAIDTSEITDAAVTTAKIADANVTTAKVANSAVTTAKIANDAVTVDKINDGEITVAKLNASAVVNNSEQIGSTPNDTSFFTTSASDGRYFRQDSTETISSGVAWTGNDTKVATTGAIDARIINLVEEVGGFVPIANETSFPAANPDLNNGTGTIVSISSISVSRTPSAGTVTIANGAGTGNTVTINGIGTQELTAGFGVLVETTTTLHTYTFHRLTPPATNVNTVASNIGNVNTVAGNNANITTVAGISSDVTTVASNNTDVTTVSSNVANVNTAAGSIANINTVANDLNEATSEIDTVATNIANVNNVGNDIANVNTVATNINSVNSFSEVYRIASSDPTSSLNVGDLVFNTANNSLRVYNGSAWQDGIAATSDLLSKSGDEMTGDLSIPDKLIHSGDPNTSIRFPSNDTVSVETSGSERLRIDSSGSVVINGTTAANAFIALNADGSIVMKGDLTIADRIKHKSDTNTAIRFPSNDTVSVETSGSERLRIDSSGNLGVGTSSPSAKFEILHNSSTAFDSSDDGAQRSGTASLSITNHDGSNNSFSQLVFDTANSGQSIARIAAIRTGNGSNDMAFVVEGSNTKREAMRIDSSGNVGIGTTSPASSLSVAGSMVGTPSIDGVHLGLASNYAVMQLSANTGGFIDFAEPGVDYAGRIIYTHSTDAMQLYTAGSERLRIDSSGNVGIGTTSPGANIHLANALSPTIYIQSESATDNSFGELRFGNGTGATSALSSLKSYRSSSASAATNLTFETTNSSGTKIEALRIDSAQRVGIGTSSPGANLHVSSSSDTIARITSADGSGAFLDLGDASDPDGGRIVYDSGSNLALYTASSERLRIDSSGNVGIGTTTPSTNLHVSNTSASARLSIEASSNASSYINFGDTSDIDVGQIYYNHPSNSLRFITNASERLRIDSSGNVGIGTTSPGALLHIKASAPVFKTEDNNGSVDYTTATNGGAVIRTTQASHRSRPHRQLGQGWDWHN